jgi:MFS family permease
MVLFLTETLRAPIALFGVILALPAIGALAGSILAPRISERFGRTRVMAMALLVSSILVGLQGFSPNFWVLAVIVAIDSALITSWNILLMSTYHQIVPSELFGRIHGTRRTLVWGMMPLGSLMGGAVATIDLRLPFFVGGVACTLLAILGFRFIVGLSSLMANPAPSTAD